MQGGGEPRPPGAVAGGLLQDASASRSPGCFQSDARRLTRILKISELPSSTVIEHCKACIAMARCGTASFAHPHFLQRGFRKGEDRHAQTVSSGAPSSCPPAAWLDSTAGMASHRQAFATSAFR